MTQYEKIASLYTSDERMEHPARKMLYSQWLKKCGDLNGMNVLDLGCGGGDSSRLLAREGANVIGVDLEQAMIDIADKKEAETPLGIKYIQADAANLPLFEKPFDLITPTFLLHYAKDKEQLRKMIQSIWKNLKPEGRLVGINQELESPVSKDGFYGGGSKIEWIDTPFVEGSRIRVTILVKGEPSFIVYWHSKATYEKLFIEEGFSDFELIKPKFDEDKRVDDWERIEGALCLNIISAVKK